jgi:hypothetical protein
MIIPWKLWVWFVCSWQWGTDRGQHLLFLFIIAQFTCNSGFCVFPQLIQTDAEVVPQLSHVTSLMFCANSHSLLLFSVCSGIIIYHQTHTHTHTVIRLQNTLFFVLTCSLPLAGHVLLFVSLVLRWLHCAVHTHLQLCLTHGVLHMYMWSDAVLVV